MNSDRGTVQQTFDFLSEDGPTRLAEAIPRQTRRPLPQSSAPTGRFGFPANITKTAFALASAYNLPDSMSGSSSVEGRRRR